MTCCPNCGKSVSPDSMLCTGCGQILRRNEKRILCSHCGASAESDELFCTECGEVLQKKSESSSKTTETSRLVMFQEPSPVTTTEMHDTSPPQPENPYPYHVSEKQPRSHKGVALIISILGGMVLLIGIVLSVKIFILDKAADSLDSISSKVETESAESTAVETTKENAETTPQTSFVDTYPTDSTTDLALFLTDGDYMTAWAAGSGSGIGESVTISLDATKDLYGIRIKNGLWTSKNDLIRNNRVKILEVFFDDGSSEILILEDPVMSDIADLSTSEGETYYFSESHPSGIMRLCILVVHPGTENITYITELTPITQAKPTESPTPEPTTLETFPVNPDDEYVLPFSSDRLLTDADLRDLTKEELRLARNEILARHGRTFKDQNLQAHFDSKSWYQDIPKLPVGVEPGVSTIEYQNVALIQEYEALFTTG